MFDARHETLDALRTFMRCAEDLDWSSDDGNQAGFVQDVDFALENCPAFGPNRISRCQGGCHVLTEWRGKGNCLKEIGRDIHSVLGRLTERTLFVDLRSRGAELVCVVVTGSTDGRFRHGHFLTLQIAGERVREIVEKSQEVLREFEAPPHDGQGRPILPLSPRRRRRPP